MDRFGHFGFFVDFSWVYVMLVFLKNVAFSLRFFCKKNETFMPLGFT